MDGLLLGRFIPHNSVWKAICLWRASLKVTPDGLAGQAGTWWPRAQSENAGGDVRLAGGSDSFGQRCAQGGLRRLRSRPAMTVPSMRLHFFAICLVVTFCSPASVGTTLWECDGSSRPSNVTCMGRSVRLWRFRSRPARTVHLSLTITTVSGQNRNNL